LAFWPSINIAELPELLKPVRRPPGLRVDLRSLEVVFK